MNYERAFKIFVVDDSRYMDYLADECEAASGDDTIDDVVRRAHDRLPLFSPGGMVSENKLKKSSGKFGKLNI